MKEINHKDDRRLLLELIDKLEVSKNNLKRDELGYWNIVGRKGHIFTDSKLWYVSIDDDTKKGWTFLKRKFKFMEMSQEGDTGGILKLERMPTATEAKVVREAVGLRKRPVLTEEQVAELKIRLNSSSSEGT